MGSVGVLGWRKRFFSGVGDFFTMNPNVKLKTIKNAVFLVGGGRVGARGGGLKKVFFFSQRIQI